MYDVVIIGSGPSGLTAAIYTVRASLKTLVVTGVKPGGQLMLTTLVENFPGFPEGIEGPVLMDNMQKQAKNLGAEFKEQEIQSIDVTQKPFRVIFGDGEKDFVETKSIIVATGADTKWLNVPGEERLIGHGVCSCAPCDAFFFRGKNVVVAGGGDSAMEEALVLAKVAKEVTIIHRKNEFRASKAMQKKVFETKNIKVVWGTVINEILGENKVEALKLTTGDKVWEMPIDGIFVAIGHKPNSEKFVGKLEIDAKGYIKRKEVYEEGLLKYWSATNVPGVFVAGDVNDYKYRQAITASGFGCIAALDVEKWLMEK